MSSLSGLGASLPGSSSSSSVNVTGLISGINTNAVIQGLLAVQQRRITNLEKNKQTITTEQSAFQGIETKLLSLQSTLTALTSTQNGVFTAHTATSSDPSILTAAASSSAVAGVYHLRVNNLATINQIASQGFDALSSNISQGTLQITVGNVATTVTIDSSNNTLQGLANAINFSGAAVTATIVNDGSGDGSQGYRLLVASKATGTSNQVSITNNLSASGSGAVKPIFDSASIGNAVRSSGFAGGSVVQSNTGTGYTGTSNNVYTFHVTQGGRVGTDDNIQLSFSDASGAHTGTIILNHGDANVLQTVAQGIGVQFGTGTLVNGDTFQVKAFVPTVQSATDASITLGSGSGALTVASASNQVSTLIPGVTLSLQNSDPNTDVAVTVANDTSNMQKDIDAFVSAYNGVKGAIDNATSYDATSGQAGPLLGNWQALALEQKVRSVVEKSVPGANPLMNNLGALGIRTGSNGQLSVDETKVSSILAGTVSGVSVDDVRRLFSLTGSTSNSGVQFITGSTQTKASSTPYTLHIVQAAQQATLTAPNSVAASTVIDGTNNTFAISLDGNNSSTLTLAPGTYTQAALAQAVQAAINGDAALQGNSVTAAIVNNKLAISSSRYGLATQVTMRSGTALTALGFAGGEAATGRDVVGNFLVAGVTETARGSGQLLTGDSSNANTADLAVQVTLTPTQVGSGIDVPVNVSRGLASQLDQVMSSFFDPISGRIKQITDGFTSALQEISDQEKQQNAYIQTKTTQLQTEFNQMEQTLAQLQSASSVLNQLAANLASNSNSRSGTSGNG